MAMRRLRALVRTRARSWRVAHRQIRLRNAVPSKRLSSYDPPIRADWPRSYLSTKFDSSAGAFTARGSKLLAGCKHNNNRLLSGLLSAFSVETQPRNHLSSPRQACMVLARADLGRDAASLTISTHYSLRGSADSHNRWVALRA
jgi:hypothetical protein